MPRKGSVDRLPPAIRARIGELLETHTLDQVMAHLEEMQVDVSRSALGRYSKRMATAGEKLRRSRSVAEALVRRYGEQPESKVAKLNIELVHGAILDLFMAAEEGEEDEEGGAKPVINPAAAMQVAKALEHLTKASRHDVEFIEKAERRAAEKATKDAATAVERVAKERGIGKETLDAIKAGIFGVKPA